MKLIIKRFFAIVSAIAMLATSLPVSTVQAASVNTVQAAPNVMHTNKTANTENTADEVAVASEEVSEKEDVEDVLTAVVLNSDEATSVDVTDCDLTKAEAEDVVDKVLDDTNMSSLSTVTYTTDDEGNVETIDVQTDSAYAVAAAEIEEIAEEDTTSEKTIADVQAMYAQLQEFYEAHPDYVGIPTPFFVEKGPINSLLSVISWGMTMDSVGHDFDGDGVPEVSLDTVYQVCEGYYNVLALCIYGNSESGLPSFKEPLFAARNSALAAVDALGEDATTEEKLLAINDWLADWCKFDMAQMEADPNAEKSEMENLMYMIETTLFGALVGSDYIQGQTNPIGMCISYTAAYTYLVQCAFPEIYKTEDGNWKTKDEVNGGTVTNEIEEKVTNTVELTKEEAEAANAEEKGRYTLVTDENGNPVEGKPKNAIVELTEEEAAAGEENQYIEVTDDNGDKVEGEPKNAIVELTEEEAAAGGEGQYIEVTDDNENKVEGTPKEITETISAEEYNALDEDAQNTYVRDGDSNSYSRTVTVVTYKYENTTEKVTTYKYEDTKNQLTTYKYEETVTTTKTEKITYDDIHMIDFVEIKWNADVSMLGEEKNFDETHFFNAVNIDGGEYWYYVDPCYNDIYVECMGRNRVETDGNMTHSYFLISHSSLAEQFDGNYEGFDTLYEEKATDTSYEDAWFASATGKIETDGAYYYYVTNSSIEDANVNDSNFDISDLMNGKDQLVAVPVSEVRKTGEDGKVSFNVDAEKTILLDFTEFTGKTTGGTAISGEVDQVQAAEEKAMDERYSSVAHTAAYDGDHTLYFNVANVIFTYDLSTGEIAKYKEYNTVTAVQDLNVAFVGMSFQISDEEPAEGAYKHTVENHPVAALSIKTDGKLYVSIATNFAKASGYEYEETNYNSEYVRYGDSFSNGGDNDNDEFLWSANFVETVDLSCAHSNTETVAVAPTCTEAGYSEVRCTACGATISAAKTDEETSTAEVDEEGSDTEDDQENAATGHHYVKFDETYYNKDDDGNYITGTSYVCVCCLDSIDPSVDEDAELPTDEELAHDFVEAEDAYTWAEDDALACTVDLVCENCHDKELDCVVADETGSKTLDCDVTAKYPEGYQCAEGGTIQYVATWKLDDETTGSVTKDVTLEGGKHTYTVEETWDEEYNCTATFTCEICGDVQTPEAEMTEEITTAPTCTETGIKTHTATFELEGLDEPKVFTKDETVAATGHNYGEADSIIIWSEDYSAATATFICQNEGCTLEKATCDCDVTSETEPATCTSTGSTVYTATCEYEGETYTTTKTVELEMLEHNYAAAYEWSEDHESCKITITCSGCDLNVTDDCKVEKQTLEPTCTENGLVAYVATYSYNEKDFTDRYDDEVIPATGHSYTEDPAWTWSEDYSEATATFTCDTCKETADVKAEDITANITPATCTEDGKGSYTAKVTFQDKEYSTTTEEQVLEATGHSWEAEFVWADNRRSCEAIFTCQNCDEANDPIACDITKEGNVYTATCEFNGNTYMNVAEAIVLPFSDVKNKDIWYYGAVEFVYINGIMTGRDETTFAPDETLQRAEFATILYRMEGEPEVEYKNIFPDVPDNRWYTDGIMWGYETGIIHGHDDGYFRPSDMITRDQIALMMYRYAQYKEYDTSVSADYSDYKDATDVSPYAREAMKWAIGTGIITGKENGTRIDPLGKATRAECATIIMRFIELYEK